MEGLKTSSTEAPGTIQEDYQGKNGKKRFNDGPQSPHPASNGYKRIAHEAIAHEAIGVKVLYSGPPDDSRLRNRQDQRGDNGAKIQAVGEFILEMGEDSTPRIIRGPDGRVNKSNYIPPPQAIVELCSFYSSLTTKKLNIQSLFIHFYL